MKVRDVMTPDPQCCTPSTPVREAARLMVLYNCGALPVVDELETRRPIGIVTDRDIVCRSVADGANPAELRVADVMTEGCLWIDADEGIGECCELLERNQVRRVIVVDDAGRCCGIVAQADIALKTRKGGEVVREVSRPSHFSSEARPEPAPQPMHPLF